MNDAINAYLATPEINETNLTIGITSAIIGGVCLILYKIILNHNNNTDTGVITTIKQISMILLYVIAFIAILVAIANIINCKDDKINARKQVISTIKQEYNVQYKNDNNIFRTPAIPNIDHPDNNLEPFEITSKNPNNTDVYRVFLKEIDGEWQLCQLNDDGEYIALSKEHAISDLKGAKQ